MKRECKMEENIDEEIKNSFDGLYNYFTAANIRDKVKHPLFLAFYFSNCISLYYNSNYLNQNNEEQFLITIQTQICNYFCKKNQYQLKDKLFQLLIKADNLNEMPKIKKIMEFFESQKCKVFDIQIDLKYINKNFSLLTNQVKINYFQSLLQSSLIEAYQKYYHNLKNLSENYQQSNIDPQSELNDSIQDYDSEFTCQQDQSNCYWEDNNLINSKQKQFQQQQQQQQQKYYELESKKKIKTVQGEEIMVPQKQDQQNMQGPIITEIQIYPPNPLSQQQKNFLESIEIEIKNHHEFYQDQMISKKSDSIEKNYPALKLDRENNNSFQKAYISNEEKKIDCQIEKSKKIKKKTPTSKIKITAVQNENGNQQISNPLLQANASSFLDQLSEKNKNIGFTQYPKSSNFNSEAISPLFSEFKHQQNPINLINTQNSQFNPGNQQQQSQQQQQQQQQQQNYFENQYPLFLNQLQSQQLAISPTSLMSFGNNSMYQQLVQGTFGNMQQGAQRLANQLNAESKLYKF